MTENWLLLRGLAREKGHWYVFPETLVKEAKNQGIHIKIHMIDLPGMGENRLEEVAHTIR